MNKAEILTTIMSHGVLHDGTFRAAQYRASDEAADRRLAQLTKQLGTLHKVCGALRSPAFLIPGFLFMTLVGFAWMNSETVGKTFDAFLFGVILSLPTLGVFGILTLAVEGLGSSLLGECEATSLKKIAGTGYCESAVHYMESSSDALQWRDIALTERSELRVFDVEIMGVLARAQTDAEERQGKAARYEAACKKAHGILAEASV